MVAKQSNPAVDNLLNHFQMDRSAFAVYELGKEPRASDYWVTRPESERLTALEYLRQVAYGYESCSQRIERTYKVLEFGEG
ncbi:MAG: hypothetical protein WD768_01970 [Phycisphaeraceae bacterium]